MQMASAYSGGHTTRDIARDFIAAAFCERIWFHQGYMSTWTSPRRQPITSASQQRFSTTRKS